MPTGAQIENQILANYENMLRIADMQRTQQLPIWKQAEMQKEINRIWQAQQYWAREYKKATGMEFVLIKPITIVVNLKEEKEEAERKASEAKAVAEAKSQVLEYIAETRREFTRIIALLQDQYDISVTWQNALFSHWVRMGAGLSPTYPLFVKKRILEIVPGLLTEAENLVKAGNYDKAWTKVSTAAHLVKWGFDSLAWWMNRLEVGAKRAEAGIKISAALATLIVSAPVEAGILGTAALAAAGEGAQQGTLLAAQGLSGDQAVTAEDLKKAALEVALAGVTAGASKGLGSMVAKGLSSKIAAQILKRNPTEREIQFVAARIEQYVAANSSAILKKVLKLDTDPDWNFWYMAVSPAINPIAMELTKEMDVNRAVKSGVLT